MQSTPTLVAHLVRGEWTELVQVCPCEGQGHAAGVARFSTGVWVRTCARCYALLRANLDSCLVYNVVRVALEFS